MLRHIFEIYSFLTKKQKILVFFMIFLGILNTLLESFGLALIIPLLYSLNISDAHQTSFDNNFLNIFLSFIPQNIYHILIIFFCIFLIKNLIFIYSIYIKNHFKNNFIEKITEKLIMSFQRQQFDKIAKQKLHIVERNIRKGFNDIVGVVLFESMSIATDFTLFFSFFLFLMMINPFSVILTIVLFIIIYFLFKKILVTQIKNLGNQNAILSAKQLKYLINIFMGYKELRIFNKLSNFRKIFLFNLKKYNKTNLYYSIFTSLPKIFFELYPIALIIVIIFYFREILKLPFEEIILIIGTFSFAVIRITPYITKFILSIQKINYSYKFSQYAFDSLKNVKELDENKHLIQFKNFESLTFEDLKFSYNSKKEIIKIDKFKINKGDVIGIFGKSGLGKSTLAEIILGYINPTSGNIIFNETKKYNLASNTFKIEKSYYLPQNIFIFDENVFSNISMNFEKKNFNNKKFKSIINKTNLIEFLKQKKYTKLGESGKEISGGERQRIGFARCLYNHWDFIVLDEATSAMDKYNEQNILKEVIKNKKKFQTVLMISHNKNILKEFCKKIYEFKNKKLIKISINEQK